MIIETPAITDLAGLIVESKAMFDEMGFEEHGNAWEYESMVEWWTSVLTADNYDIVIARKINRIVGVSVVCYTDRHLWHKGPLHACEVAHHAAPDLTTFARSKIMIKMLDAIREKVAAKGAKFFKIGYVPKPGFDHWGRYLKSKGFQDTNHVLVSKVG